MAKQYAPLNGAWEVLTLGATATPLIVLAKSRADAHPTNAAPLVMLAEGGAVAQSTLTASFVVLAETGFTTLPTQVASLPMWTLLANAPLYRGRWRHSCNCRSFHETL